MDDKNTEMKLSYITELGIKNVRHLKNIDISLCSSDNRGLKHLMLTGKNGSGKTSVLDALSRYLDMICRDKTYLSYLHNLQINKDNLEKLTRLRAKQEDIDQVKTNIQNCEDAINQRRQGLEISFNCSEKLLQDRFEAGEFILAYFRDNRIFDATVPKHVEKVPIKESYAISEDPRKDFIKYLVDKKVSQSLYQTKNELDRAKALETWFDSFEALLRDIFEDPTLILDFDVDTFQFKIREKNREAFDFNSMSAGYAAILDIVVSIIMRMEARTNGRFEFDMPGIVLIDELETHLHYELQKKVLPFLCNVFPNIQFVVSTHSAFILNSIDNAVIYDLENRTLVKNGLSDVPYEGIIKGYFDVSTMSQDLQEKLERYKVLVRQNLLSDEDLAEVARLSIALDEIPDYLAPEPAAEYQRLKTEFNRRKDL